MRHRLIGIFLGWLLALALVAPVPVCASHTNSPAIDALRFAHLSSRSGLMQNTVNRIYQDSSGLIWLATQGGLHRYDGYQFQVYQHEPGNPASLSDSFITDMVEDAHGRLWVGTLNGGLNRLDIATGQVRRYGLAQGLSHDTVTQLLVDQDTLWIGNGQGLDRLDLADERIESIPLEGSASAGVTTLSRAPDQALYLGTPNAGVLRLDIASRRVTPLPAPEIGTGRVNALYLDPDGSLWIASGERLWRHHLAQGRTELAWQPEQELPRANSRWIAAIQADRQGQIWLAGRGLGLVQLHPGQGTGTALSYRHSAGAADSLGDDNLRSLYLDRSGVLWIGSDYAGVDKLNIESHYFQRLLDNSSERERPLANQIRAIHETRDGELWLGTDGAGLKSLSPGSNSYRYHNQHFARALDLAPSALALRIFAIAEDRDGALWLASSEGLARWRRDSDAFQLFRHDAAEPDSLPSNTVRSLLLDHRGGLWVGTDRGLALYQPETARFRLYQHSPKQRASLSHNTVLALAEDGEGQIWVGTLDGLNRLNPTSGETRRYGHDSEVHDSLSDNRVRAIHIGGDGTIWVGTHNGLNRLSPQAGGDYRFQHYLAQPGLANDTIYAILEDAQGRLWLSTNRGLSRFEPDTGRFRQFDESDGLQGFEYNGGSAFESPGGEMYFGGIEGFNRFRPESVRESAFRPPLVLTAYRIADRRHLVADPRRPPLIRLDYDERVIGLEFAALDYTAPERNQFAYRLEGVDKTWIANGNKHEVTYTNLAPGPYRFLLKGANKDGVWNEEAFAVAIEVVPPLYRTSWAYAFYGAAGLALGGLLLRARRGKLAQEARINTAIRESEERLKLALWGSGDGLWDWDLLSGYVYRTGLEFLGYGPDELAPSAEARAALVHPDDRAAQEKSLQEHLAGLTPHYEAEYRMRTQQGDWLWILDRGKVVERDAHGRALRMVGTHKDVSARKHAERDLRLSAQVIRDMNEAVVVSDLNERIVSINPAFSLITGYAAGESLGVNFALLNSARHKPAFYRNIMHLVLDEGAWNGELWLRTQAGEDILVWMEINPVRDEAGKPTHIVSVFTDITGRKQAEEELRYLANYDTLTALPNRTLFQERLSHAITQATRHQHRVALLFLDLDRFKHINDSLGHHVGDLLLQAVATRLRQCVRAEDTVARLGGDEFTIILEGISSERVASVVAGKVVAVFTQPMCLDGREVVVTPSIGISLFPDDGDDAATLVKYADTAMYHAKELGRNNYQFYTEKLNALAVRRMQLETSLRRALENDELSLVYQPKSALSDGHITGVETLIRWDSQDFGIISPMEFIPLAEETGLIVPIGEWVLRHACQQYMQWRAMGLARFTIAINLSARQFTTGDLIPVIERVLNHTGMPAAELELELTESMIMTDAAGSIAMLNQLKGMGLKLAVDDFGTGYSSLSYLKRFPIDTLKIDREFVRDISSDPDDAAITSAIIAMAHSLELKVVAEGVETRGQLDFLRHQGCDEIQGYFLARPLPAEECEAFLRQHGTPKKA